MPIPIDLDAYRWKNRLLVVFAPNSDDLRLARQDALLRREGPAMRERDLLKIVVLTDDALLRRRYRVAPRAFTALLIGKDGTLKERWNAPVTPRQVYALIDAMPMRRDEMRRGKP